MEEVPDPHTLSLGGASIAAHLAYNSNIGYGSNIGLVMGGNDNNKDDTFQTEEPTIDDIRQNCLRNVSISLFWEEKTIMILRFIQFYGYLMLVCYEMWPNQARYMWGYFFFFMSGSFYFMLGSDQYYNTI